MPRQVEETFHTRVYRPSLIDRHQVGNVEEQVLLLVCLVSEGVPVVLLGSVFRHSLSPHASYCPGPDTRKYATRRQVVPCFKAKSGNCPNLPIMRSWGLSPKQLY